MKRWQVEQKTEGRKQSSIFPSPSASASLWEAGNGGGTHQRSFKRGL